MAKNSTILVLRVWYRPGMFGLVARVEWNKLVIFVKKWTLLHSILFRFIPIHSIDSTLYHNSRHTVIQCYLFWSYMYVFQLFTSLQSKS